MQTGNPQTKDKCHFTCTQVPFFGKTTARNDVKADSQKLKAMMEMAPPKAKKKNFKHSLE